MRQPCAWSESNTVAHTWNPCACACACVRVCGVCRTGSAASGANATHGRPHGVFCHVCVPCGLCVECRDGPSVPRAPWLRGQTWGGDARAHRAAHVRDATCRCYVRVSVTVWSAHPRPRWRHTIRSMAPSRVRVTENSAIEFPGDRASGTLARDARRMRIFSRARETPTREGCA